MTSLNNPFRAFVPFQQAIVDSAIAASGHSLKGLARLRQLHLQAIKASLEESGDQLAKAAAALESAALTTGARAEAEADEVGFSALMVPLADKTRAYMSHVQTITTETGTDLAKVWEQQVAASGKALQAMVDVMATEATGASSVWSCQTGGSAR